MLAFTWRHRALPLVVVGLVLSALFAGGVHRGTTIAYALAVVLASAGWLRNGSATTAPRLTNRELVPGLVALGLSAYCLLQIVPWPLSVLSHLAADNADVWERSTRAFAEPAPAFASLSLAPGRTVFEGLKLAVYGLVFFHGAAAARRYGMTVVAWIAFGAALVVALVTGVHQVLGAESLFGLYEPVGGYARGLSPVLNPNSRAGYVSLGFFCGLGTLFVSRRNPVRALVAVALAVMATEVLLAGSRGATGCFALGLVALAIWSLRSGVDEAGWTPRARAIVIAGVGVSGLAFALLATRGGWLGLQDRSTAKVHLFEEASRMAWDHFFFGVGRGAFGSVHPAYQASTSDYVFDHVENFPLQWASEWGVPVAVAALGTLGWALWPALTRRRTRRGVDRFCVVGCLALLLQNLVDLGLEIPAVASLACFVLGGLAGSWRSRGGSSAESEPGRQGARRAVAALAATALLATGLTLGLSSPSLPRLRRDLHALAASESPPPGGFWRELRKAVAAFPADPYLALLGATASASEPDGGGRALAWINRALERGPTSSHAHLELARILLERGVTGQALGAMRRALELSPRRSQDVVELGRSAKLSLERLRQAAPDGAAGAELLRRLALVAEDRSVRVSLLREAVERDPALTDAHHQLAAELLRGVRSARAEPPCGAAREQCLAEAERHALLGRRPGSARDAAIQAWVLQLRGQPERGEELLRKACERNPSDRACDQQLLDLALESDSQHLDHAVSRLVASRCSSPQRCAEVHSLLGGRFSRAGKHRRALAHYRDAARANPTARAWRTVARVASKLGQPSVAADAERRARRLPSSAAVSPASAEERRSPTDSVSSVPVE